MILIISFISSFVKKKVNLFPALTAPFYCSSFLSNVFIAFEAKLLTNPGTLFLTKEIATFFSDFWLNYLTKNQNLHLIGLF